MITLALETSTACGSVALFNGNKILFNESFEAERGQSMPLFLALERARAVQKPDQIAVGLGPGSYSGVRIAIATAIGLSLSVGAPLLGISSLLAFASDPPDFAVIGDARRHSFYFAHVEADRFVEVPQLLAQDKLAARILALRCPLFTSATLAAFPTAQLKFPTAERLARLAAAERGIIAREQLEPLYLRDPHITQPRKSPSR